MLKKILRQNIVQGLWETYCSESHDIRLINAALKIKNISYHTLDHFAVIDLPGPHSGIPHLNQIFSAIGYIEQGRDYLADKQNDFVWMSEVNCTDLPVHDVLPQVVVADFRLDELPVEIKKIIYKYSSQAQPSPTHQVLALSKKIAAGDTLALIECTQLILNYLVGRDWSLPGIKEYYTVREFNELLAWVLVFGRRPNHFTLPIHLFDGFSSLDEFHHFIEDEVKLSLNLEGGVLKGGKDIGIAQGSTSGIAQIVQLADGAITLPTGFVEFVWRYPVDTNQQHPLRWGEYFTGFVATQANGVIESLYIET